MLRAVFESAQDSIFIKDRAFRYVKVSPAMEQLSGLPAREYARMIGIRAILSKPISGAELSRAIRLVLNKARKPS